MAQAGLGVFPPFNPRRRKSPWENIVNHPNKARKKSARVKRSPPAIGCHFASVAASTGGGETPAKGGVGPIKSTLSSFLLKPPSKSREIGFNEIDHGGRWAIEAPEIRSYVLSPGVWRQALPRPRNSRNSDCFVMTVFPSRPSLPCGDSVVFAPPERRGQVRMISGWCNGFPQDSRHSAPSQRGLPPPCRRDGRTHPTPVEGLFTRGL
jgi:hypothetical protein